MVGMGVKGLRILSRVYFSLILVNTPTYRPLMRHLTSLKEWLPVPVWVLLELRGWERAEPSLRVGSRLREKNVAEMP